ncbi:hypothetical protein LGN43_14515 [Burkholderia multivorans]|nr:hypothetical protein [Burkholderia multivorans]
MVRLPANRSSQQCRFSDGHGAVTDEDRQWEDGY